MRNTQARNHDILIRRAAGETLSSIHRSYPEVSYPSIVDVARNFREKFIRAFDEGATLALIAKEWGIAEQAVEEMVE